MTSTGFSSLYSDVSLKETIRRAAARRTRNHQDREDLCQEAWLYISTMDETYNTEVYERIAEMVIHRHYKLTKEERALMFAEWMGLGHVVWSAWNPDYSRLDT